LRSGEIGKRNLLLAE